MTYHWWYHVKPDVQRFPKLRYFLRFREIRREGFAASFLDKEQIQKSLIHHFETSKETVLLHPTHLFAEKKWEELESHFEYVL